MNLQTEMAVAILIKLEADGYLKAGARFKDETLLPKVADIIGACLESTREEFAKFCIWWAEIGHQTHQPTEAQAPFAKRDFWHCSNPMCLSLVGTIADLSRELNTTPSALAESADNASPPLS